METTFYDVPLMRGSPEYFDSLKANQPVMASFPYAVHA